MGNNQDVKDDHVVGSVGTSNGTDEPIPGAMVTPRGKLYVCVLTATPPASDGTGRSARKKSGSLCLTQFGLVISSKTVHRDSYSLTDVLLLTSGGEVGWVPAELLEII